MKKWKGITKKLFSAFFALALVATILPANVMAGQDTSDTPDVTLTAEDIQGHEMYGSKGGGSSYSENIKGITVQVNANGDFYQENGAICIKLRQGLTSSLIFAAEDEGKKIKQINLVMRDKISMTDLFISDDKPQWGTTRSGDIVWGGEGEGEEDYESLPEWITLTCPTTSYDYTLNVSKIEIYFADANTTPTPTADNFTYDSSTGLVSAQTGIDLGTVTTYYKVDGAWTNTKPTAVGTYEVGVVTEGSDTYKAIGSAAEPFTATWTYEVKASGAGTDTNASDTKANTTTGSDAEANTTASTTTVSPKTGDASNLALYLVILVAGIAGCAGVAFKRRKEF